MSQPFILVIPAAGSGHRMGSEIPKPFLTLGGKTVLEHTVGRFTEIPGFLEVVVATSPGWISKTRDILQSFIKKGDVRVVEGGRNRQESVYRALLQSAHEDCLVAIHDAVRPFTDPGQIEECLECAGLTGAAILAVPVSDTIKEAGPDRLIANTPKRDRLWKAQTPQIFRKKLILKAHREAGEKHFSGTDDASLVEWLGEPVKIVQGSVNNIKLTHPVDLRLAEWILKEQMTGG